VYRSQSGDLEMQRIITALEPLDTGAVVEIEQRLVPLLPRHAKFSNLTKFWRHFKLTNARYKAPCHLWALLKSDMHVQHDIVFSKRPLLGSYCWQRMHAIAGSACMLLLAAHACYC